MLHLVAPGQLPARHADVSLTAEGEATEEAESKAIGASDAAPAGVGGAAGVDGGGGLSARGLPGHRFMLQRHFFFEGLFSGRFAESAALHASGCGEGGGSDGAAGARGAAGKDGQHLLLSPATAVHAQLSELSPSLLAALLRWTHAGDESVISPDTALPLFAAATMYGVRDLAAACEAYVCANVDEASAAQYVEFAEAYGARKLLTLCRELSKAEAGAAAGAAASRDGGRGGD